MSTDLVAMIGNVSQSMFSIQRLLYGGAYVLGVFFIFKALGKFRSIGDKRSQSAERLFAPTAYLIGGAAMLFLPTTLATMANTFFGVGNVLQYTHYSPYDIYSSMGLIIRTAGVLWFIRGCVLLVSASHPGVQEGPKGMMFVIAGILAMNFENTVSVLTWVINRIASLTLANIGTSG